MNRTTLPWVLACAVVGASRTSAFGQDLISCYGTESGGDGIRQYQYDVWNMETQLGNPNILLTSLVVGTDDLNIADYTNILMPAGWIFSVQPGGIWENPNLKTPHGQIAPPPPTVGLGTILFRCVVPGQEIQNGAFATFGFDNPNAAQNVDWFTGPPGDHLPGANWLMPVAGPRGFFTTGPVHGPVPAPGSVVPLAGLLLLRGRRR